MDEIAEVIVEVGAEVVMAGAEALMGVKVKDKEKENADND